MTGIVNKLIVGVITTGTLGGVGYGIHTLIDTTDNVKNYLIKNGFTPRTTGWNIVLEAYKLEKTSKLKIFPETEQGISSWCELALKRTVKSTEESNYQIASHWCIEFKSIKEKLGNKQFEQKEATLNSKLSSFSPSNQAEIRKIEQAEEPNKVGKQIRKWCEINSKRRYSSDTEAYFKDINANCLTTS